MIDKGFLDRAKLPVRIIIPLVLLVFSGLLALYLFQYNTKHDYRHLEESSKKELTVDMTRLQSALEYLWQNGHMERMHNVVAEQYADPVVLSAYLIDNWGSIRAGLDETRPESERATVLLAKSPVERNRRTLIIDEILTTGQGAVYLSDDGTRVVGLYAIRLAPVPDDDALQTGILFMERDLTAAKQAARSEVIRQVAQPSVSIAVLAALMWLFFHLALNRRVARLVTATERLAAGDLSTRSGVSGMDEVGRVAQAFDRMVRQLEEGRSRLTESEARVVLLLDSAAEAIFGIDLDGKCTFSNRSCLSLLGYTNVEEMRGQCIHDLIHHSYPDGTPYPVAECHIQNALISGQEVHVDGEVLWRADGTCFPSEYWSHPIRKEGEIVGSVVTFVDITKRKRAEDDLTRANEALETRVHERTSELVAANRRLMTEAGERERVEMALTQAKEEAETANQAKSEFLSRMSHELRTPMNAILGFAQILESDPGEPLSSSQHESVREILIAGYHLLELINEVLDLSRIDAGRLDVHMEPVPVGAAVDSAIALIEPMADRFGVTLDNRIDVQGPASIMADITRLRQVLLNLLSNAVKYNTENGTVTVTLEEAAAGAWRISVTDTGPGIPEAQQARLFQPFTRLSDDYTAVGGTGIGLTITRRLVELMDGHIGFVSAPGDGTCFFVEFAAADATVQATQAVPEVDMPPHIPETPETGHSGLFARRKVLYIEDNSANVELVRRILARRGDIEMLSAATAGDGIDVAVAHRPDVVLVDIHLPDMSGFQVLETLRGHAETRHMPVLAFSGESLPQDVEKGLEAGFFRYLTKPADIRTLLAAIDEAMPTN